jgi:NTE family protein
MMHKRAFVLSGGGAKGAFQVGVLKALYQNGIHPDFLVGTSTGALNSLGLSHVGLSELEKVWLNIKGNSDILKPNWMKLFLTGYYQTKPLKKLIDEAAKEPAQIPAWVCFLNMETGEVFYRSNQESSKEDFAWAVYASSVMPVIMEPVNQFFVDGGLREQAPLEKAIKLGADEIYLILTSPIQNNLSDVYDRKFPWIYHDLARAVDLMSHEIYLNDFKICNYKYPGIKINVIAPDENYINTLDFNPDKIRQTIKAGYTKVQSVQ